MLIAQTVKLIDTKTTTTTASFGSQEKSKVPAGKKEEREKFEKVGIFI